MGLLGTGWDDPQSAAIMALADGLLQNNFGGGLMGANNAYAEAKQAKLKEGLLNAQMQNYLSEVAQRDAALKRQQEGATMLQGLLSSAGGYAPAQSGQMGSGTFGILPPAAGQSDMPARRPGGLAGASPDQIAALDALYGYKLMEPWKIAKEGFERKPGSFYENATTGKREYIGDPVKGITLDANGNVVLMPNAANTQSQLTFATEAPKTLLSAIGTVNLRDNPNGNGQKIPVSAYDENPTLQRTLGQLFGIGNGTGPMPGPAPQSAPQPAPSQSPAGYPRVSAQDQIERDKATVQVMRGELQNPNLSPQDRAAIERDIARRESGIAAGAPWQGGSAPASTTGGIAYGPTTAQDIQNAAAKAKAEALAKGDAERANESAAKGVQFKDFRDQMNIARNLLQLDPTHSVPGAAVDSVAGFFGQATSGAKVAKQLDLVSAWMTQNIPKAPGSQSNYELDQYKAAASDVGNKTLPVETRVAALDTLQKIVDTWEQRRATGAPAPQEPAGTRYSSGKVTEGAPNAIPLPSPKPSAKDLMMNQAYTLPDGRIGVWDGMRFKVQ